MAQVFVILAQGVGDSEDEYVPVAVATPDMLETMMAQLGEQFGDEIALRSEEFELNA